MKELLRSPIITHFILQTIAMMITALLIPRLRITSITGALGAVLALAFVNATIWDAALFFNVPDSLTTQTLLLFLANGTIFWVIVKVLPGIETDGFLPALIAPVVFTFTSVIIDAYGRTIDWVAVGEWVVRTVSDIRNYFLYNTR
jgi:uncharacterized membrane protein YvlD (DUF360 family)